MEFTALSTIGELAIDGVDRMWTLELPVRDGLAGSAIPPGRYPVTIYPSPHFGREMPLLQNVPGRSEIEIHFGNYPTDSRGCILVGLGHEPDMITESRLAFDALWDEIEAPARAGTLFITVAGGLPQPAELNLQGDT
jgi:hypothetical protein